MCDLYRRISRRTDFLRELKGVVAGLERLYFSKSTRVSHSYRAIKAKNDVRRERRQAPRADQRSYRDDLFDSASRPRQWS